MSRRSRTERNLIRDGIKHFSPEEEFSPDQDHLWEKRRVVKDVVRKGGATSGEEMDKFYIKRQNE